MTPSRIIVVVAVLVLLPLASVSSALYPYALVYGGPEYDAAMGVAAGGSGVYTSGFTNSTTGPGDFMDGFIIRHMPSGPIEWARIIDLSPFDVATRVVVDGSDNAYVAGGTVALGPDPDMFVGFFTADGSNGWVLVLNDTLYRYDIANSIYIDGEYIYLVGTSYDPALRDSDIIVAKLFLNWTVAWAYIYGDPEVNESGTGIVVDDSGNIYVSGTTNTTGIPGVPPSGDENILVHGIDPDGTLLWSVVIDLPPSQFDRAFNIDIDEYGNLYVVGEAREYIYGNDIILVKLYTNGTIQWVKRIDYLRVDEGFNMDYENGFIYITGAGYQPPPWNPFSSEFDVYVLSVYPNGTVAWFKTFGGPDIEWGLAVDALPSGDSYVAGFTRSYGAGYLDAFLTYFDPDTGQYVWCAGEEWAPIIVDTVTNATSRDALYTLPPYDPITTPIELIPENFTELGVWTPEQHRSCSTPLVGGEAEISIAPAASPMTAILVGSLLLAILAAGRARSKG